MQCGERPIHYYDGSVIIAAGDCEANPGINGGGGAQAKASPIQRMKSPAAMATSRPLSSNHAGREVRSRFAVFRAATVNTAMAETVKAVPSATAKAARTPAQNTPIAIARRRMNTDP